MYHPQSAFMMDLVHLAPYAFIGLVVLTVFAWIAVLFLKNKDNIKPSQTCQAKVIEVSGTQNNNFTGWYTFEIENGERVRLLTFNRGKLLLNVGDEGELVYRGTTIVNFTRQGK